MAQITSFSFLQLQCFIFLPNFHLPFYLSSSSHHPPKIPLSSLLTFLNDSHCTFSTNIPFMPHHESSVIVLINPRLARGVCVPEQPPQVTAAPFMGFILPTSRNPAFFSRNSQLVTACWSSLGMRYNTVRITGKRIPSSLRRGGQAVLPGNKGQDKKNGLKVCQGKFGLDFREYSFSERIAQPWHSYPGL